jgi:maltose-binding protein MalE
MDMELFGGAEKMTKKAMFVLAVVSLLALSAAGAAHADDWKCISDRNSYRVAVYVRYIYYPDGGCNIAWKVENQNDYPIRVKISNKEYLWSGGSKFVSSSFSTTGDVGANAERFIGDDDIIRSPGDSKSNVRVDGFEINVQKR